MKSKFFDKHTIYQIIAAFIIVVLFYIWLFYENPVLVDFIIVFVIIVLFVGIALLFQISPLERIELHRKGISLTYIQQRWARKSDLTVQKLQNIAARISNAKLSITLGEFIEDYFQHHMDIDGYLNALRVRKNAGLSDVITRKMLLEIHHAGGDMEKLVDVIVKAEKASIDYDLDSLIQHKLPSGLMPHIIDAMIRSRRAGSQITQQEILAVYRVNRDKDAEVIKTIINDFSYAKIKMYKAGYNDTSIETFIDLTLTDVPLKMFADNILTLKRAGVELPVQIMLQNEFDGDIITEIVDAMVTAKEAGLTIDYEDLVQYERIGGNALKIISALIKAQEYELKVTFDDLERYYRIDKKNQLAKHVKEKNAKQDQEKSHFQPNVDLTKFIKALLKAKSLQIPKEELFELHLAGIDIMMFVKAVGFAKGFDKSAEEIKGLFLEGRDVLTCLLSANYAKQNGLNTDFDYLVLLDRIGKNVVDLVREALHPQILKVEPVVITAQDGIQLKMRANVSIVLQLHQNLRGSREKVLFERINEILIDEVGNYPNHKDVLKHLNKISKRVLIRLQGKLEPDPNSPKDKFSKQAEVDALNQEQIELNNKSAYKVLNISIPEMEVDKDIYAHMKKHHAELEAEIKLLLSKANYLEGQADIEKAFAEAIRNGASINDYLKSKIYKKKEEKDEDDHDKHDDSHDSHDNGGHH